MFRNLLKKSLVAFSMLGATFALAETRLNGGGATFPNPLYQKWVTEYQKLHADVKIDYASQGSGFGIKGITAKTLDFAGSDAPMSKKEIEELKGVEVVQIPSTAGAIVPAFNLPGITELNLTAEVIADIYLGKITKWNDPAIATANAGVNLPDTAITPAYRTDSSGTTFVFTSYLSDTVPAFKEAIGASKAVEWKVGQGGKGNAGVAQIVQSTSGAIGYIELNYATANKIAFAAMKNQAGKFVKATPAAVSAAGAAANAKMVPGKLTVNIWNQPGDAVYPISGFTYLIVYKDAAVHPGADRAGALVDFLKWAATDGQKFAGELDYAPLAPDVAVKVMAEIESIKK